MRHASSQIWLPITVVIVLVMVGASIFSGYQFVRLKHDTDILRSLPKDDATWGALQLNYEVLKLSDALHSVVNDNSLKTRKALSLRMDILYSRMQVMSEVFFRYEQLAPKIKTFGGDLAATNILHNINDDFKEIQFEFSAADRDVQVFLESPSVEKLVDIRHRIDRLIPLCSELASQINQYSNLNEYNIRGKIISRMEDFQWTLVGVIFIFLFFSLTSLALYVKAQQSERRALQTAKDLEVASQAKTQFLSSMSHELRTPMNAVLGFAQLLKFNPKEPLSENQKNSVDLILRGGGHLLELIEQVLELSTIEAGKLSLNIDRVSTRNIIDESLHLIRSRASIHGIKIVDQSKGEDLPLLWTDGTRLKQVLLNLLSNAVKYNRENGTVTLMCQKMPDQILRISVEDTGKGIPSEKQNDLFKPFERLGLEAGQIEGTGIGLTITKEIIELMGGRIGFRSEVDKGTTFWVDVPICIEQIPAPQGLLSTERITQINDGLSLRTILYVEDNPANIQLMEVIIGQIVKAELLIASTAQQGIDLAKSKVPDLILMDINLPGMNGLDAMKQLKAVPATKAIPVIAISAAAMPDEVEAGKSAGFKDYITKPFDVSKLIRTIEETLDSHRDETGKQ